METTDISYLSLAVGLLLLAIPLYFFHRLGARLIRSTVTATVRMVLQLLFIGFYLHYLFEWNNPAINVLWVLIMVLVATFTAAHRTRLRLGTIAVPLFSGLLATAAVVGMYFLVLVLGLPKPFDARYFVPIMGILMGNMLSVNVIALNAYYDSLQREQHLYYYLLGNGATHLEAVMPLRQAGRREVVRPVHCQYGSAWHSLFARNHDRADSRWLGTGHRHQIPNDDNRHNILSINAFAHADTAPRRPPLVRRAWPTAQCQTQVLTFVNPLICIKNHGLQRKKHGWMCPHTVSRHYLCTSKTQKKG